MTTKTSTQEFEMKLLKGSYRNFILVEVLSSVGQFISSLVVFHKVKLQNSCLTAPEYVPAVTIR